MLDRPDRNGIKRRGTDLVRVQQTRALSRKGRDENVRKPPAIYLSEMGPGRIASRVKWFVSTLIVGIAGLSIIGIVIYASMNLEDGSGMIGTMRRASLDAMKPKSSGTLAIEKPVSVARKTSRIVMSAKGIVTKNIIRDNVMQRRGTRDFMLNKAYVRLVSTLATEKPDDTSTIPPFNASDLIGNETPIARKETTQNGAEPTSDPRVTTTLIDVSGGFLPREDNQELTNDEVERLVAEADAIYRESEAGLTEGAEDESGQPLTLPQIKAEKNTTVLFKKTEDDYRDDSYETKSIVGRGGENLEGVIKAAGVDATQSSQISEAVMRVTKSKKLRAGEEVRLALVPSSSDDETSDVAKISIFYQGAHVLTLVRGSEGIYGASDTPVVIKALNDDTSDERATIYMSTYRAAMSQDLPQDFVTKFLKIHAYDADFKLLVKPGDQFDLFYELIQDESGAEKPGELLFAAITIGGETRGYYRFRTPDGLVDYYDDKGSNSKKFLMKVPLRAGRLTSLFGWRRHPLLKTLRRHTGVDWAGPVGTPIYAAGNGTIEAAGREGGYGNYIRIRHANGYKTAYGHLLRFAEGVSRGVKVRQGQTVGYLGSTGLSSGPHLHYEVLVNNRHVNPLSIKIPRSRQLQGRLLTEYRKEKARIDELMQRPPVKTRVSSIEK